MGRRSSSDEGIEIIIKLFVLILAGIVWIITLPFKIFSRKKLKANSNKKRKMGIEMSVEETSDEKFNINEIRSAQWSAMRDNETCDLCKFLDGKVVGIKTKEFMKYKNAPGRIHSGCRCLWIYIMKEEVDPPEENWPTEDEMRKFGSKRISKYLQGN